MDPFQMVWLSATAATSSIVFGPSTFSWAHRPTTSLIATSKVMLQMARGTACVFIQNDIHTALLAVSVYEQHAIPHKTFSYGARCTHLETGQSANSPHISTSTMTRYTP